MRESRRYPDRAQTTAWFSDGRAVSDQSRAGIKKSGHKPRSGHRQSLRLCRCVRFLGVSMQIRPRSIASTVGLTACKASFLPHRSLKMTDFMRVPALLSLTRRRSALAEPVESEPQFFRPYGTACCVIFGQNTARIPPSSFLLCHALWPEKRLRTQSVGTG